MKKLPVAKLSIFEDNLTSFKDESTPTKMHSMAASSLSSLTIDDDDDYDMLNKIIINNDKSISNEVTKIEVDKREEIPESCFQPKITQEKIIITKTDLEDLDEEKEDELTDLTPHEEQILDQCIRKGIAKRIKRNINEIKPFSWDLGITCRATKSLISSKLRKALYSDFVNDNFYKQQNGTVDYARCNNNFIDKQIINRLEDFSEEKHIHRLNKKYSIAELFHESEKCEDDHITYEEYLLDQCIRRGIAKITKRHINDFKPFFWDINGICLTTRALILHNGNSRT